MKTQLGRERLAMLVALTALACAPLAVAGSAGGGGYKPSAVVSMPVFGR